MHNVHKLKLFRQFCKLLMYSYRKECLLKIPITFLALFCSSMEKYILGKDALSGKLVDYVKDAKPSVFFGVPRVYEKMAEKMQEAGAQNNFAKKALVKWAKDVTFKQHKEGVMLIAYKKYSLILVPFCI